MTQVGIKNCNILRESLVTASLRHLAFKRIHPALLLSKDIRNTKQITFGVFKLSERVFFLLFRLSDSCCLLKDLAPILWLSRQKHVDLPLLHNRIRRAPNSRIHEKIANVTETAAGVVNEELGFPVGIDPTSDRNLVIIGF